MRGFRNFICFINSLILTLASLWLLFNIDGLKTFVNAGDNSFWLIMFVWIVFFLGLLAIFMFIIKGSSTKGIVRSNEMGKLKINLKALEDMAEAEVKRIAGLKVIKTPVTLADNGVKIEIKVGVAVDERIPDLALIIQRNVKEAIEKSTEIPVVDVKVIIGDIFVPTKARVE